MGRFIIGLVVGLVIGGLAAFFLFVGFPGSSTAPGEPIRSPDAEIRNGSAQVVLTEELFNQILATIFRDLSEPAFPLADSDLQEQGTALQHAAFQDQVCDSRIRILAEGSGVRSGVQLEEGRIRTPLAFAGSYNSAFGCLRFTGSAQAGLELRFEKEQQAVFGRLNVESVTLDGINPLLGGIVTPIVQPSINTRVNPIQILHGRQLAIDVPIDSTGGNLQAVVEDVRAEIKEDALNLFVIYNFSGKPVL